ncbi:MAG: hypothetical protein ABIT76_12795 [Chthoniobacterales bacterium]
MSLLPEEKLLVRDRNVIAVVLSAVPGAGQLYKGHYAAGIVLMLAMPFAIVAGVLLSPATMGMGLLLPVALWAFAGVDAYLESDLRKHRWSLI